MFCSPESSSHGSGFGFGLEMVLRSPSWPPVLYLAAPSLNS